MAMSCPSVRLWSEQLPALPIDTTHGSAKARRCRHPHPTWSVQLEQSAIAWTALEITVVSSSQVPTTVAICCAQPWTYWLLWFSRPRLSWLIINPNEWNENVEEWWRIILVSSQMNLKWSTQSFHSKQRKLSQGHCLLWDGFCKAGSSSMALETTNTILCARETTSTTLWTSAVGLLQRAACGAHCNSVTEQFCCWLFLCGFFKVKTA